MYPRYVIQSPDRDPDPIVSMAAIWYSRPILTKFY